MDFRNRYLTKLKENIELKSKLNMNADSEKNELNSLNGAEMSENDDSANEEKSIENIERLSDDDDDNFDSMRYPDDNSSEDPLKHISQSDAGASGSGL